MATNRLSNQGLTGRVSRLNGAEFENQSIMMRSVVSKAPPSVAPPAPGDQLYNYNLNNENNRAVAR